MKKCLIILLVSISAAAHAQLSAGNIFISGSVGISNEQTKLNDQTHIGSSFNLSPKVGFLLSSSFAVGIAVSYGATASKYKFTGQSSVTDYKSHSFSANPFVRYYIPISESVYFALNGQLNFIKGVYSQNQYNPNTQQNELTDTNFTSTGASIAPMLMFFPSEHWSIEAGIGSLGYAHTTYKPELSGVANTSSNNFGFNAGQISIGFSYYFKK